MLAEFRRNLWLELGKHRLIATPIIFTIFWTILPKSHYQSAGDLNSGLFYAIAVIFIFLLGSYKATTAVVEEIRDHTWDFQTISPITPSAMTFGKLFGSTSFAWYTGLLALFFHFLRFDNFQTVLFHDVASLIEFLALFFLLAITTHAVCLFSSISNEYRFYQPSRLGIFVNYLLGLLPGLILLGLGNNVFVRHLGLKPVIWYDLEFSQFQFLLFFIVLALFWSTLGSYRAMKMQLRFPVLPIAWIAFLAFLIFFVLGFELKGLNLNNIPQNKFAPWFRQENMVDYKLAVCTFIMSVLLYFNLITRPIDIVKYRKMFAACKNINLVRAFQYSPVWLYTTVAYLALIIYFSCRAPNLVNEHFYPASFVFGMGLLALRDIALLHNFSIAKPFRAVPIWVIYIFLLDFLIPTLMMTFGMKKFIFLLVPTGDHPLVLAALPLVVQIAILCIYMGYQVNQRKL